MKKRAIGWLIYSLGISNVNHQNIYS